LVELRLVTDRQTNGQTHNDSIYRATIASCGKKAMSLLPSLITKFLKVGVPLHLCRCLIRDIKIIFQAHLITKSKYLKDLLSNASVIGLAHFWSCLYVG